MNFIPEDIAEFLLMPVEILDINCYQIHTNLILPHKMIACFFVAEPNS